MAILDRAGVKISYQVYGQGPTILLSHGYSASVGMWAPQIEALSDRYRVITWDMRGHGASAAPADQAAYSEEATVADMIAVLDQEGAARAVIGGLSVGGYMSLAFHARHPDRTAALLLFDTGPGYRKDEARDSWNAMAERYAQSFERRGLDALGEGAEVRAAGRQSAAGLARAARGMLAQRDARVIESLPRIAVPVLVLAGEQDEQFLAPTDYMAAKIPGAVKVIIPGAGHAANIDAPAAFNSAVLGFLEGITW